MGPKCQIKLRVIQRYIASYVWYDKNIPFKIRMQEIVIKLCSVQLGLGLR